VALACGGPDAVSNLQWQTIRDARAKDRWERKARGPPAAPTDRTLSLHNRYRATMIALGIMGVTTPAERLTTGGVEGSIYSRCRSVPLTNTSNRC
jgi:hypothetical protein